MQNELSAQPGGGQRKRQAANHSVGSDRSFLSMEGVPLTGGSMLVPAGVCKGPIKLSGCQIHGGEHAMEKSRGVHLRCALLAEYVSVSGHSR